MTTQPAARQRDVAAYVQRQGRVFQGRRRFMRDVLVRGLVFRLFWRVRIAGQEHLPAAGGALFVINHSTLPDPVLVVGAVQPRFIVPMSKIENFRHPFWGVFLRSWGAYPVRRGEIDRRAIDTAVALLQAGEMTMMAPEGTRSPALIRAKNGATHVAVRSGALVVPTAVYGLANWGRDFIRPWKRTPAHIHFGQPFRVRYDGAGGSGRVPRAELRAMTDEIMYRVAALLPEEKRGYYAELGRATTQYLDFT